MLRFKHVDENTVYEYDMRHYSYSPLGDNDWLCWPEDSFCEALNSGDYVVVTDAQ